MQCENRGLCTIEGVDDGSPRPLKRGFDDLLWALSIVWRMPAQDILVGLLRWGISVRTDTSKDCLKDYAPSLLSQV